MLLKGSSNALGFFSFNSHRGLMLLKGSHALGFRNGNALGFRNGSSKAVGKLLHHHASRATTSGRQVQKLAKAERAAAEVLLVCAFHLYICVKVVGI
jgi:hypothetical protein